MLLLVLLRRHDDLASVGLWRGRTIRKTDGNGGVSERYIHMLRNEKKKKRDPLASSTNVGLASVGFSIMRCLYFLFRGNNATKNYPLVVLFELRSSIAPR